MKKLFAAFLLLVFSAPQAHALIGGERALISSAVYLHNPACSGVLVAPHVILTAGHCILHKSVSKPLVGKGTTLLISGYAGNAYSQGVQKFEAQVVDAEAHPLWREVLARMGAPDPAADQPDAIDIGVIVLDRQIPNAAAELPLIGALSRVQQGQVPLRLTGSGCESKGRAPTQRLKQATARIQTLEKNKVVVADHDASYHSPLSGCAGDSGGAAYLPNSMTAIALISTHPLEYYKRGAIAPTALARLDTPDVQNWLQSYLQLPRPASLARDLSFQSIEDELTSYLGAGETPKRNAMIYGVLKRDPTLTCKSDTALRRFGARVLSNGAGKITETSVGMALHDFRRSGPSCP